jgi:hypothetical protein
MEETSLKSDVQDQMVMFILMDLVDHDLLTVREADLARRIYLKEMQRKRQADYMKKIQESGK